MLSTFYPSLRWWPQRRCWHQNEIITGDSVLGLVDLIPGFLLLAGGLVLSALAAVIERCIMNRNRRNSRNRGNF